MTVLGRIDLHYPDGRSEKFLLGKDAISIGSAADNTIAAADASLAPRHLRISHSAGLFFLSSLDPDHLTTIDDAPVPVNERRRLQDVARIRAGDLRIVFNRRADNPTVAMKAVSEATQPTAVRFRAALESGEVRVWQYSSASVTLSVTNTSAEGSPFSVETSGPAADWTSPDRLSFSVDGKDAIDILFHLMPTRLHDKPPGVYPLTISVRRLDDPGALVQLVLLVHLGAVGGLSGALNPAKMRPGQRFNLRLLNLGNSDLPLRLSACDPHQLLNITLAQAALRLGAGEGAIIGGIVELRRRPIIGKRVETSFAVLAQAYEPNDYVMALPAAVTATPVLGKPALMAAALAIAIIILAAAALLYQPPQPAIASFTLSEAVVAQGETVDLSWSAEQARRFVLEVNRAPVAELPGDAASFALDTSSYADPIDIALIALNGDATDIRSLRLDVYQPATVIRFEVDKSSLLRDLPSELTIRWQLEGAVALDIALPVGFETIRESVQGGEGEIVIAGVAADDAQITLNAVDEIGKTIIRTITVSIREPECTATEDTRLRAGPDQRFGRARYAMQNVPVIVNGVTAGKDWLQVELASGDQGWARVADFFCPGFDPASLPVISDIPQLPTAIPTLPPAPTASATRAVSPTLTIDPAGDNS